jgi:TfoX/Sxy family transcriptional regulator of competence genes
MTYNRVLAERVKEALASIPDVEERKMFGGITFMVNGKMCVSVSGDRLMCRVDPAIQEEVLHRKGTQLVTMRGREYKGYIYVIEEVIKREEDFSFWIGLSLEYNKKAKASVRKKK